jgi:CRP/FNR family cyclic AMP-dependent transcriptional regulator
MLSHADRNWPPATLLGRVSPLVRAALLSAGTEVRRRAERPIIHQGEAQGQVYLLLQGVVKVVVREQNGKEALLGIRVGGDLVGEMAALEELSRSADVVPCCPLVARVIQREQLLDLMNRHAELAVEVAKMISQRLRWANRRRLDFTAHDPRTRMARIVTELLAEHGRRRGEVWELGIPLTQAELAQLAGVKLRTAEKELRLLESERVLQRQYRGIEVTDIDRLRSIALS